MFLSHSQSRTKTKLFFTIYVLQVLEMARDCLHKSESKQVTSSYFYDMADSLDRLLAEVNIIEMFICILINK